LLLFILYSAIAANGQTPEKLLLNIDSLEKQLSLHTVEDAKSIKLLNHLSLAYSKVNPAKGKELGMRAATLAGRQKARLSEAEAFQNVAVNLMMMRNVKEALPYNQKAREINRQQRNLYGEAIAMIGLAKCNAAKPGEAMKMCDTAMALFQSLNNKVGMGLCYSQYASIYMSSSQPGKAIEYFQKAIEMPEFREHPWYYAAALHNMGNAYSQSTEAEKGLQCITEALKINEAVGNKLYMAINLNALCLAYARRGDMKKAIEYEQKALALGEDMGNPGEMAMHLNTLGSIYLRTADYKQAIENLERASQISESIGDKEAQARTLVNTGVAYAQRGYNEKAMALYRQSLEINKSINNVIGEASVYSSMATLYEAMSDYLVALKYAHEALASFQKINNKYGESGTLHNTGILYKAIGEPGKAREYYEKALSINMQYGFREYAIKNLTALGSLLREEGQIDEAARYYSNSLALADSMGAHLESAVAWQNLGYLSQIQERYEQAREYFAKALVVFDTLGYWEFKAQALDGLGVTNMKLGKPSEAFSQLYQSRDIAKSRGYKQIYAGTLSDISMAFEKMERFDSALAYHQQYLIVKDSILNDASKKELTRKELQLAFDYKESEYLLRQQIDAGKLKERDQAMLINQQLLNLRMKELSLSNKEKDLQRLAYLKEKAEKQEKEVALGTLQLQMKLKEQQAAAERERMATLARERTEAEKTKRNYLAGGFIFLLLSGTSAWIIVSQRRKAGFQQKVSETEMRALRAQMNPHFIFNALNSVYRYLQLNERKAAEDYLMNFSQLTRLVLENSMQHSVSLDEELKALELYMGLESERLNKRFHYSITVAEEIDAENTLIPPLLLQPFVENSIWHGVTDEAKTGQINISIARNTNNQLLCVIEDNGLGRRKVAPSAEVLKNKKKSLGMSLTQQRIDIINKTRSGKASVLVKDITDMNNIPQGLRVELLIPLELAS
jgi:tetratricopeptide (TPR) repeat protein